MFTIILLILSAVLLFIIGVTWPKRATKIQIKATKMKNKVLEKNNIRPHFVRSMINGMVHFSHKVFTKSAKKGKRVRKNLPF